MAFRLICFAVVLLVWCVALHLAFGGLVPLLVPGSDPLAAFPFASVHLSEEALGGLYQPLLDPPFQIYLALMCSGVFLVGGYWVSSRLRGTRLWIRFLPMLAPLLYMAFTLRPVIFAEFAGTFRSAAIISFLLFFASAAIGTLLSGRADNAV